MLKSPDGQQSVVTISSMMGRTADRGFVAYGTAKAALAHWTKMAAQDLAPRIRVNGIYVGSIMTSSLEFVAGQPELMNQLESKTPLGRVGEPEDIAACVLYLASQAGQYVTGKLIEVDGGIQQPTLDLGLPDLEPERPPPRVASVTSSTPTAYAVSPDSGEHWTAEGAWQVADGIHRIPLPLPMDGLKAINVYVITTDDGLVLIDGGWAIPEARELLDRCLRSIGSGFGDIRRFLVTHIHRDHFTMAGVLGRELGVDVALGLGEKPALDLLHHDLDGAPRTRSRRCCAPPAPHDIAELWNEGRADEELPDLALWQYPDTWLDGDHPIPVGRPHPRRRAHARATRPGHYVFADRADRAAVRRRPRAADDHPVDRLHGAADAAAAGRLHGLADQGARAARPAGPAGARSGRAVVARPRRRAAGLPRAAARPVRWPRSPPGR